MRFIVSSLLLSSALFSFPAIASQVSLMPTSLIGDPSQHSHAVTLTNADEVAVRYQVTVHRWIQEDGIDKLEKTGSVLASPSILEVPANGRRVVRLVRVGEMGGLGYYRVVFQQLPQPQTESGKGGKGANLSLLVNHSLPLAFEASKPDVRLTASFAPDGSGYQLFNDGTTAARVSSIGPGTGKPWREGALGWVLPGMSKIIPLKPDHRASVLVLTVNGQPLSLSVIP